MIREEFFCEAARQPEWRRTIRTIWEEHQRGGQLPLAHRVANHRRAARTGSGHYDGAGLLAARVSEPISIGGRPDIAAGHAPLLCEKGFKIDCLGHRLIAHVARVQVIA